MNLNPLDLHGPQFLAFFAILLAITAVTLWVFRRQMESGGQSEADAACRHVAKDPYLAAFLRGGREEVIRVAVISLVERGFLEPEGSTLTLVDAAAADQAECPLDKAILIAVAAENSTPSLFVDALVLGEADQIGAPLQKWRLVPDANAKATRLMMIVLGVAFLWLVAVLKIAVALSRGRTNIAFLVLLAVICPVVLILLTWRSRTALGDKVYRRLQDLFAGLRNRRRELQRNQTTSEMAFLAAVFGMAVLPASMATVIAPLPLHRPKTGSSGCSAGSSCGGGGGGGCGGGGCGGGCGGCG